MPHAMHQKWELDSHAISNAPSDEHHSNWLSCIWDLDPVSGSYWALTSWSVFLVETACLWRPYVLLWTLYTSISVLPPLAIVPQKLILSFTGYLFQSM